MTDEFVAKKTISLKRIVQDDQKVFALYFW